LLVPVFQREFPPEYLQFQGAFFAIVVPVVCKGGFKTIINCLPPVWYTFACMEKGFNPG
jgi:hypothetical protein